MTGAASGIGRAIARLFAEEGAHVALLDRDASALGEAAAETGGHAVLVDLLDPAAVSQAVASAAEALGGVDAVVNSAGIVSVTSLAETDLDAWQRMLGVNLTAPYLVCRTALPWLRQAQGATIVNIGSAQALRPVGASAAYAASKAGVVTFTKALAGELAPAIRANAVCPGIVDTPMVQSVRRSGGGEAGVPTLKDYPLGRMAQPREIAEAVLWLSCDRSAFVTGIALAVDGGRTFH
ncbi:SDR family NAD(P)-dependent oxidoreductase [Sphingosinicella terrae]|uniref:SDR family NAD(P)-dependent oxidoreductase n=1 Tax=Sphingosinicella terrae TaxID=2172047 RepID=UPI003D7E760C